MHSNTRFGLLRWQTILLLLSLPASGLDALDNATEKVRSIWEAGEKANAALQRIQKAENDAKRAQAAAQERMQQVQTQMEKTAEAALRQKQEIERMETQSIAKAKQLSSTLAQQQRDVDERIRQLDLQLATTREQTEGTLRQANGHLEALGRDRDELRRGMTALTGQRDAVIAKLKLLGVILVLVAFIPLFWRPLWRMIAVLALRHLVPQPRLVAALNHPARPAARARGQKAAFGEEGLP